MKISDSKKSRKQTVIAKIIGESSAGMLALEFYQDDVLVWSHDYMAEGTTSVEYDKMLRVIAHDAEGCEDWRDYEGCDYDDCGDVQIYHRPGSTTWIVAEYADGIWTRYPYTPDHEVPNDWIAYDFLAHNRDLFDDGDHE